MEDEEFEDENAPVTFNAGLIAVVRISDQSISWFWLEDRIGAFIEKKMGVGQDIIREILLDLEPDFVPYEGEIFVHFPINEAVKRYIKIVN